MAPPARRVRPDERGTPLWSHDAEEENWDRVVVHGTVGGAPGPPVVPLYEDRVDYPAMAEIEAHITGTVWKIECRVGDTVEEGDTVVVLESMKMEMPVEAEDEGTVAEILCEEGQAVSEGDVLVVLE